jgi:hypothetical protein
MDPKNGQGCLYTAKQYSIATGLIINRVPIVRGPVSHAVSPEAGGAITPEALLVHLKSLRDVTRFLYAYKISGQS